MTNEALAALIQQGGNDELLPVLWEKTAKLLYKISAQTYTLYKDTMKQHGIEPEDLNQEAYKEHRRDRLSGVLSETGN